MPVQIRVVFADSTDTVMRVMNDRNRQVFGFSFSKQPAYPVFDPYRNILLKVETTVPGPVAIEDRKKH